MAEHTQESLDDTSFRDLQKIAKDLELSAQGGRDELTARILAHQDGGADEAPAEEESAPAEVPADEAPAEVPAEEEVEEAPAEEEVEEAPAEEEEETPERAREDNGQYAGDDKSTQPDEAYEPPTPQPLTPRAIAVAGQTIAGYIGVDTYTKAVEKKVVGALEAGKQPCIVEGKGNARFEVKVFDKLFDKADFTSDVVRTDGAVMNIARRLADANLYPTAS